MPPLVLYNRYSVLAVEENDEPVSTVTQSIEAMPPPPTAQPPPTLKAYPPQPTWENHRVPQCFVIMSSPPDLTNSLDLHVGLRTTDTGAEFHTRALIDSGATGSFIDREFVVQN